MFEVGAKVWTTRWVYLPTPAGSDPFVKPCTPGEVLKLPRGYAKDVWVHVCLGGREKVLVSLDMWDLFTQEER